jgi:hypothetical protein
MLIWYNIQEGYTKFRLRYNMRHSDPPIIVYYIITNNEEYYHRNYIKFAKPTVIYNGERPAIIPKPNFLFQEKRENNTVVRKRKVRCGKTA